MQYMTGNASAAKFTEALLSTIRLQRHIGVRVVISTQEPTISGKLLDLCTSILIHKFHSPEWLSFLKSHLAGAGHEDRVKLMARIVELDSGEAFLFSPSSITTPHDGEGSGLTDGINGLAIKSDGIKSEELENVAYVRDEGYLDIEREDEMENGMENGKSSLSNGKVRLRKFGLRYMKVKIRKRVTADGGKSVLAVY
jgi:hypothetical protein